MSRTIICKLHLSLLAAVTVDGFGAAPVAAMSASHDLSLRTPPVAVRYDAEEPRRHTRHRHRPLRPAAPSGSYGDTADSVSGGAIPGRGDGRFHVNRYGFGNYSFGPNGSYGGYPPGSAGYDELLNNQRYKCDYAPQSC